MAWDSFVALTDHGADGTTAAQRIAAARMPLVLTGSPAATEWRAAKAWADPARLAELLGAQVEARRGESAVFVYEDHTRLLARHSTTI